MQKPEKTEMQKQKKREIDRRYRQKKKKAVVQTKIKLAMTMIENENLKSTVQKLQQEIIQLTKQLNSMEPRPDQTTYDELQQEIKYLRVENEVTKCLLKDTDASYISDMIKVLKENEDMKRAIEHYERLSSQGVPEKA
ncbi:hypothetical protein Peur_019311 [Populus x canadensis]